jgi:hypothetical protein
MKLSKFSDIFIETAGRVAADLFGTSANIKGCIKGFETLLSVKGHKWLFELPFVKPYTDYIQGLGLYNPDAPEHEQIDGEAMYAFLEGYTSTDSTLRLGRIEIDCDTLKALAKRLKEVDNVNG